VRSGNRFSAGSPGTSVNRTQWLVLTTVALAWVGSVLTLTGTYKDSAFGLFGGLLFQLVVSAVFGVFVLAAIRRWRWAFFVLLAVCLFNALSVTRGAPRVWFWIVQIFTATSPLYAKLAEGQLESVVPVFLINLLAFTTGVAMLVGLVRRGIWGAF